jgi:hypothetical protein
MRAAANGSWANHGTGPENTLAQSDVTGDRYRSAGSASTPAVDRDSDRDHAISEAFGAAAIGCAPVSAALPAGDCTKCTKSDAMRRAISALELGQVNNALAILRRAIGEKT